MPFLVVNPNIVLREEFEGSAILFDPDSGFMYGLKSIGLFVWKLLARERTLEDILEEVHENYEGVPLEAERDLEAFIEDLIRKGLLVEQPTDPQGESRL